MKRVSIIVVSGLIWAGPARADVVVDWNVFTAEAIAAAARPSPANVFDSAMVHLAMQDAIQAIEGRFQRYCASVPKGSGSPIAAAATAAHDVLVSLFPAQTGTLDPAYDTYLADRGLTANPGVVAGQQAAACILDLREGDGRYSANPEAFYGGTGLGEWRPTSFLGTPPVPVPMVTPWVATVTPFTLRTLRSSGAPRRHIWPWQAQGLQRSQSPGKSRQQRPLPSRPTSPISFPTTRSCYGPGAATGPERISATLATAPGSSP
jgi:hypothetical protein